MTDSHAKINFVFETLKKSGVSMSDFSKLTNISRTTLYSWRAGEGPDLLRLQLAFNIAVRLDRAVLSQRLPFAESLKAGQRLAALRQVINQVNQEMRG